MSAENDHQSLSDDVSALTEISQETMIARWHLGLVTPMSSTINTFAKTDGTWWTAGQAMWSRVSQAADNERLDFHHERFGRHDHAKGPVSKASASPWDKRPGQSLFPAARKPGSPS